MQPALHCHFCKGLPAPFRFRKPGFFSQLSEKDRRYLRACSACREKAEAYFEEKFVTPARLRPRPADPAPPVAAPPAPSSQGDLFAG